MNIFLLSKNTSENILANKLLSSHHCNNLFVQSNHSGAITLGTTVSININDFEEVEAFCIAHKVDLVVINEIELLEKGLFDFLNDNKRNWKGIVTGCSSAFFEENFATTTPQTNVCTIISDGKKYFNISSNSLIQDASLTDSFIEQLNNKNLGFNGFIEISIANNNEWKYFPCISKEEVLLNLETDIVSVFAAAYNGTFEDVNIEFYS